MRQKAKSKKHIHFMGIGGSGMAFAAGYASEAGYEVTGCDLNLESYYLQKIKKSSIKLQLGHNPKHLEDIDFLVVSPAILYQEKKHPEYTKSKKNHTMTWQKFCGDNLHSGKKVICITGTHGKSTTSALATHVFEKANLKPSAIVGSVVKSWGTGYKYDSGKYFIQESDEFGDNFLNYSPECIILNNIEFDHPDYFKTELQLLTSFEKHIKNLTGKKILIVNQDSLGIKNLFEKIGPKYLKKLDIYGYTLKSQPLVNIENSTYASILKKDVTSTTFSVENPKLNLKGKFSLSMTGQHNVENSLGVIVFSKIYGISPAAINKHLSSFKGLGRRMDLIGKSKGVLVYDDYAHHPTAIKATLEAIRQKHQEGRIIAVSEPHMYSRTKALLTKYNHVFDVADFVVIAPIFKSRDKEDFGLSGQSVVDMSGHRNIKYIDSFQKIENAINRYVKKGDVVVVMGAGDSFKLARDILDKL